MKKRTLCIASLILSMLLLNNVFVSASDEFWIMELWLDSPTNFGISTDSDSNVIVAYTLFTVLPDSVLIKVVKMSSESGQVQWDDTYNDELIDYAKDVVVDSQDDIVVLGNMGGDWIILKYDSSGTQLWLETYDGGEWDLASGVAVDSDDNIIVTGKRGALCITRKYDSNGDYLDEMIYEEDCTPWDVAVDSEDNVVIIGDEDEDYFIVKYDGEGKVWRRTFDRGNIDRAYGVAVDSEDNIVVTGHSEFLENSLLYYGYLTLKYDPSGAMLWAKAFDNMEYESYANDVDVDQADNIYVTGRSGDEVLTIRYDEEGNSRWARRFSPGPHSCTGQNVVVDADGNLVVACYSGGTTDADYYIIKYLLQGGDGQSSIDELSDDVASLEEIVESLQGLIQGILDWIGRLPRGLRKLYG